MVLTLDWVKKTIDDQKNLYYFDFRYKKDTNYSALEAALQTINYIVSNYPKPYRLYLSGGVDSQAMLYAWHISGQAYETYSARYNYNLNQHDLIALETFANLYNININFFDFNLIDFLKDEHHYYAKTYLTGSPQFTSFMKMVSMQESGTAIMSGNFLQTVEAKKFINHPCKNGIGLYHYARKKNNNFIPFFFLEQPYLAYAFTPNTYVNQFIDCYGNISNDGTNLDYELGRIAPYFTKVAYYTSHGFPVLHQYKKLNGFELVKNFYDDNYEAPANHKLLRTSYQKSTRVFDLLYRNKYEVAISKIIYNATSGLL